MRSQQNTQLSSKKYTQLMNSRDHYGSSYRAIQQLYNELALSTTTVTAYDPSAATMGAFVLEGNLKNIKSVYIYDYCHSMNPVCVIVPDGADIIINVALSELCRLEDLVASVKSMLTKLITKGLWRRAPQAQHNGAQDAT